MGRGLLITRTGLGERKHFGYIKDLWNMNVSAINTISAPKITRVSLGNRLLISNISSPTL